MKTSRLLVLIGFLTILAMATHMAIDEDTWWHLRAGKWMVDNRALITEDLFSYTRFGEPWQYPGLWVQVVMFLLFDLFGPAGLNLWVSFLILGIFFFVWKSMQGEPILKVLVLLLAASASAIYWAARPYLITYLLAAVYLFILERYYRGGKGHLWILPVLMVVWVNSHGGYLAGFLIILPFLIDAFLMWLKSKRQGIETNAERAKLLHILWVFGLLLAATLLNPSGFELWSLPFSTVSRQAEQIFIAEWQSPNFHENSFLPFGIMLILLIVALGASKKQFRVYQLLLAAGFAILGLYSIRNIFFFVIVATPLLLESLTSGLTEWKDKLNVRFDFDQPPTGLQKITNVAILIIFSLGVGLRVSTYLPFEDNWEMIAARFPVDAVEFIRDEQPEGNLFNTYNFGGYCIWALPEYPVFVDGRADLHGDEIILEWYRTVKLIGDWENVLTRWDVGVVLLEPDQPLAKELIELGWQVGYTDDLAVVLFKD